MQKKWSVLIIPNTSEQGFNVTITGTAVRTGIIALCLFVVASSVLCAASLHAWKKTNLKHMDVLEADLAQQGSELTSLKNEYAGIVFLEEKLRAIAGLKPRHSQIVEVGVGGQGGPSGEERIWYDADEDARAQFLSQVEHLSAKALRQNLIDTRDSFSEILDAFEKEQDRLSSIPSINPVADSESWISSTFGYRKDPINGRRSFHEGLDIVAPRKTPVIAPAEGVVTFAGWHEGLGRAVKIRHGYGYQTIYGHNDKLLVKKGDTVSRGDIIALLGSSGRSTGPHLHYEVLLDGKLMNPYRYVIE